MKLKVVYNNKTIASYDIICNSVIANCNLQTLVIAYELSIRATVSATFRRCWCLLQHL